MKSIEIEQIKKFTGLLFAGETFDGFLVSEAFFHTAALFSIDGHINEAFLEEDEKKLPEYREGLVFWKKIRPICFEIIKGKKVPSQFKVVFRMSEAATARFLKETGCPVPAEQVGGLFLNIHFREGKLFCITGTARKTFSMDKTLDLLWDEYVENFLKKLNG